MQRASRLAKYLPRWGVDLMVIASSHAGIEEGRENTIYVPTPERRAAGVYNSVARMAQRVIPYDEHLEWVPHAVHAARRIAERERITAVISTSPPLGTHLAALFLKVRYHVRWVADFRDPLYGNPNRPHGWTKPYDLLLEGAIFHSADALVAVTDAVRDEWRARYPKLRNKMHLIWNGFDPEQRLSALPLSERGYRELAHVGVLYRQRHPYTLITAVYNLIASGRLDPHRIRIRFLGPMEDGGRFESHPAVSSLLANGCLEIQPQLVPRQEANRAIATSDLLLLIDIVNLSGDSYTVPAKIYDYLLVGRPILALTGRNSPVERILAQSGVPNVCVYHADREPAVEDKLLRFFELPSTPVSPSSWFLEAFDGARQVVAFRDLLMPPDKPPLPR